MKPKPSKPSLKPFMGVIADWRVLQDGGIGGICLVYNGSMEYALGVIDTSPVVTRRQVSGGWIIETYNSHYFLVGEAKEE